MVSQIALKKCTPPFLHFYREEPSTSGGRLVLQLVHGPVFTAGRVDVFFCDLGNGAVRGNAPLDHRAHLHNQPPQPTPF